ncbi:hypothetical protein [Virgisporangium aurantiacum]|uniref:hypothetical protein n=1 Tax=Virgisporangium aurantiacum TaxID=175570 RepID=UPI00194DD617|nr:hypothetical protein [Virgisporangium aurantiacum]
MNVMTSRAGRRVLAGLLTVTVAAGPVLMGAGPAAAAPADRFAATGQAQLAVTPGEVGAIASVISAAFTAYRTFTAGSLSVEDATRQILNAIYSAKVEVMARIDAVAAAQARACAQDAVLDFENFDSYSRDSQEAFAMAARSCVNLIDSLLATGPDKAAADQLGFALLAVGPIMLIVRSRIGVSNTSMIPVLIRSTQAVITQLTPTCNSRILEGRTQWFCRVYGDHTGGYDTSLSLAQRTATGRTSRPVAQRSLPILQTL